MRYLTQMMQSNALSMNVPNRSDFFRTQKKRQNLVRCLNSLRFRYNTYTASEILLSCDGKVPNRFMMLKNLRAIRQFLIKNRQCDVILSRCCI